MDDIHDGFISISDKDGCCMISHLQNMYKTQEREDKVMSEVQKAIKEITHMSGKFPDNYGKQVGDNSLFA